MNEEPQQPGFFWRLHRALGPILGGLLLDFTDLATYGPMGILGPFLGAAVVLWITSLYRFSVKTKIILAFLGRGLLYGADDRTVSDRDTGVCGVSFF